MSSAAEPACPICGGLGFTDFNRRPRARCLGCGSLERGRQQWLALRRCVVLPPGAAIAHFAPERFFLDHFAARRDVDYRAFDIAPEHYPHASVRVERLDLCGADWGLEEGTFDLVIHNHVLEHLPCAIEVVLVRLKRLLKTGGVMLFSVPIVGDRSIEGLDPATTPAERAMRAAQGEHLRIFGKIDFPAMLRRVLGSDCLTRQGDYASQSELRAANVPVARNEPNGKSVFLYRN
jgi:SAM-dependent methyltransferase